MSGVGDRLVEHVPPLENLGTDHVGTGLVRVESDGDSEISQGPIGSFEPAVSFGTNEVSGGCLPSLRIASVARSIAS